MGELISGCNVMQHFCISGSDAFGGYITYIDRDEAIRNEKISEYNLYNDYMGNPEKTTGLFTKGEDRLSGEEKRDLKMQFVNAQMHGSIMWQTVISFDNRWLAQQGLYEQKGDIIILDENKIKEVVRYGVTKMYHNENLDHITWSAAIHYNTGNIHVHIAAVEENPSRAIYKTENGIIEYKGKFKQSSIELCKSTVVNEILQQRDLNLLINKVIRKDIVEKARERQLMQDPQLREKFLKLIEQLPDVAINMMNYNTSIMSNCRPLIDEISGIYLNKYHKNDYEKLTEMVEKQSEEYRVAYGNSGRDYANGKKRELYERLGNAVLKEVKNYLKAIDQNEVPNLAPENQMEAEVLNLAPEDQVETEVPNLAPEDQNMTEKIPQAEKWLIELAENGNHEMAQYALGKFYSNSENEYCNLEKSIHYYTMAADQGNQYAQYKLGKIYLSKESGVYDLGNGIDYLEKSMNQNNEWAKYELGKLYLDTESEAHNAELGMQYMSALAYGGNQYAQCKLGFEYLSGKNIDRNITLSKAWFSKSAQQGNEMAIQMLNDMNESGARTLKGLNSWGELDRALYALQKSMNEEYQQEWQNIKEYEQMIRNEPEESLEID